MEFKDLKAEIWDTLKCFGCGACVGCCPKEAISFKGGDTPERDDDKCNQCGTCYTVCPATMTWEEKNAIAAENGKTKGVIGHYKRRYFARSSDFEIIKRSQSFGVATTVLKHLLEEKIVDAAIVVSADEMMRSRPVIARSYDDLKKSSKVKYVWAPVLAKLREIAFDKDIGSVAIVGTPCVIQAVRRIQKTKLAKYKNKIKFALGLFCWEIFRQELIYKMLLGELQLDIDPRRILKFSIKKRNLYVELIDGAEFKIPLEICAKYARKGCQYCTDFTNELADISIGDAGSPKNYSTVITRTAIGEKVFKELIAKRKVDTTRFSSDVFSVVENISAKKKQRVPVSAYPPAAIPSASSGVVVDTNNSLV